MRPTAGTGAEHVPRHAPARARKACKASAGARTEEAGDSAERWHRQDAGMRGARTARRRRPAGPHSAPPPGVSNRTSSGRDPKNVVVLLELSSQVQGLASRRPPLGPAHVMVGGAVAHSDRGEGYLKKPRSPRDLHAVLPCSTPSPDSSCLSWYPASTTCATTIWPLSTSTASPRPDGDDRSETHPLPRGGA
jgi:hypothetical protein